MKPKGKGDLGSSQTPSEAWYEFIQAELKQNSKIGRAFEKAGFVGLENKIVTVYFEDETVAKIAKGKIEPLKNKLPSALRPCDRVQINIGQVSPISHKPSKKKVIVTGAGKTSRVSTPLQTLYMEHLDIHDQGSAKLLLEAATKVEIHCRTIYDRLKQRTESLVIEDGVAFPVSFSWRLRVGGTRGFMELLLPVFHPVFGVPYIPASSLKGAARAWARQNGESKSELSKILGILDGKVAQAAKVEFLDAFPTKECLSVDVATPQWHWQNGNIAYKPVPHPLLSMEQPQFLIGLRPTKPENAKYIPIVKEWLENALKSGIGSRVSSGYGRALGQSSTFPNSQSYDFELWTQGVYGADSQKVEFRPTAIRGILRYWFRAVALSLYQPESCQELEEAIFGKLSQQGKISITTLFNNFKKQDTYCYNGKIYLETKEQKYLELISQILILASHLGGFGRGSRRPFHLLHGRMRGCHWSIDADRLPIGYDLTQWQKLFQSLRSAFQTVQTPIGAYTSSPGNPGKGNRCQDSLDSNAQVWLLKSPNQLAPDKVTDWKANGNQPNVLGSALSLLYSNTKFKGENQQGLGNKYVGGAFGTPSFVWIKSIFPRVGDSYQVVTIFGVDQTDRLTFAKELDKLAKTKPSEAILVFGKMPNENPPQSNRPIRRK
jgi:CRISPR-associated protein Cmr6